MGKVSWAAYGLGVVVVVALVLMSTEVGPLEKSIVVAATLFVGAVVAALNEIARAVAGQRVDAGPHRETRERAGVPRA